jgi:hypothetical protein
MVLIVLREGKIMKKYLLMGALALVTVWATGCIVIDAEKVQSRTPATIRSEECVVYQSHAVGMPALESGTDAALETTGE